MFTFFENRIVILHGFSKKSQMQNSFLYLLSPALLPEYAGGLHRHGPQRHDAGAAAFEGAGDRLHRRAADPPLGGAADGLNM